MHLAQAMTIAVTGTDGTINVLPHHAACYTGKPTQTTAGRTFDDAVQVEVAFAKAERPAVGVKIQRCAVEAEIGLPHARCRGFHLPLCFAGELTVGLVPRPVIREETVVHAHVHICCVHRPTARLRGLCAPNVPVDERGAHAELVGSCRVGGLHGQHR